MSTAIANIRDVVLLSLACVAGALLAPVLPVIGLPLCAAGLGGLVYRGYRIPAAVSAVVAVVVSAWARPVDAIAAGIALAGILVAASALRRTDAYSVGVWLAPLFGLGFAVTEVAAARLSGIGFSAYLTGAAEQAADAFGTSGTLAGVPLAELSEMMLRFAPAVYLMLGAASAVPTLVALVWSAARTGAVIRPTPKLQRVDLSPHVLWPLVLGVAALAAGRIWGGPDGLATTVGLNILLVVRLVLLLQGLALVAAMLARADVRGIGFVFGMALALVVDSATWFVSLAGLSDFWLNFRRLVRGEAADGPQGTQEGF